MLTVDYFGRPASLRPAMRSGFWIVWPETDQGARIVRGHPLRSMLDGPFLAREAARLYPEHAAAILSRRDTTD